MRPLTASSYAVLGLLAVRPRSAYDLVGQMKRSNVRLVWPRAESKLYEEPKNLVAHGLATVRSERGGRGPRAVYRITRRGRAALRRWLQQPSASPYLESEGLLKVALGDFGTTAQLRTNVQRIRDDVIARAARGMALARELADVGPRFPERAHVNAVADRFVIEVMWTTLKWAEWAERVVGRWPAMTMTPAMAAEAKRLLRANADAVEAIAAHANAGRRPRVATAATQR